MTSKKKEEISPLHVRPEGGADLTEKIRALEESQFVRYRVQVRIKNMLAGGVARRLETTFALIDARISSGRLTETEGEAIKKQVVQKYHEINTKNSEPVLTEMKEEETNEDPEALAASRNALEASWNTFWADERGLYAEARTIKSAIRNCMSTLNIFQTGKGARKKTGHNDGTYLESPEGHDRIYFMRNGDHITEADDYEDRPVLLKGKNGPTSAIKRIDVIWGDEKNSEKDLLAYQRGDLLQLPYCCQMEFIVRILKSCSITEDDLVQALTLLEHRGLGAMNSQGFGKFKIEKLERL